MWNFVIFPRRQIWDECLFVFFSYLSGDRTEIMVIEDLERLIRTEIKSSRAVFKRQKDWRATPPVHCPFTFLSYMIKILR